MSSSSAQLNRVGSTRLTTFRPTRQVHLARARARRADVGEEEDTDAPRGKTQPSWGILGIVGAGQLSSHSRGSRTP